MSRSTRHFGLSISMCRQGAASKFFFSRVAALPGCCRHDDLQPCLGCQAGRPTPRQGSPSTKPSAANTRDTRNWDKPSAAGLSSYGWNGCASRQPGKCWFAAGPCLPRWQRCAPRLLAAGAARHGAGRFVGWSQGQKRARAHEINGDMGKVILRIATASQQAPNLILNILKGREGISK